MTSPLILKPFTRMCCLVSWMHPKKCILKGIKHMLRNIFLPAILATSNWGALNQSKQGESEKHIFTEIIHRYLSFLDGATISIEGTVMLKKVDNIDFSKLHTFEEVTAAAGSSEMVPQLEDILMMWYKQIEQVLIESEQMSREADDSSPLTELEHWKRMSARFNYIIEQIKGSSCKVVINVLNVAHSKLLKNWRDLDARITNTANESKDNVHYLYTLEKLCQPLYNYDLVSMAHGIHNLTNAIRMIHSMLSCYKIYFMFLLLEMFLPAKVNGSKIIGNSMSPQGKAVSNALQQK